MARRQASTGFRIIPFTQNGTPFLPPRNFILPGQYLESPNKQYKLILEADINLVLYNKGVKTWVAESTNPHVYVDNRPNKDLVSCFYMQGSAFLVDHVHRRTWATRANFKAGAADRAFLQVQDDGNVVIIDGVPTWARFGFTPTAVARPRKLIYDTGTNKKPYEWFTKDVYKWTF